MVRLLTILILLGAAIAIFFVPTRAIMDQITPDKAKVADLKSALDNADKIDAAREKLQAKYASFTQDDIEKLNKLLPSTVDSVRLVIDINTIASRQGMVLTNVTISPREKGSSSSAVGPVSDLFEAVRVDFTVTGDYVEFKNFLNDLARSVRIIDVEKATFISNKDGDYSYTMSIKTYWLKNPKSI